jgi:hypothetical protein
MLGTRAVLGMRGVLGTRAVLGMRGVLGTRRVPGAARRQRARRHRAVKSPLAELQSRGAQARPRAAALHSGCLGLEGTLSIVNRLPQQIPDPIAKCQTTLATR